MYSNKGGYEFACRRRMTMPLRASVASFAAVSLTVLISFFAMAGTANATPIPIGQFFFDLPDGVSPTVHVTNDSLDSFTSFTIDFVNDVVFDDQSTAVDTPNVTQSLLTGEAFQIFPVDLSAPAFSVTPRLATLSAFVFSRPGTISFSPDGGTTLLASAVLDLTSDEAGFGIFFDEVQPTEPEPVPEPGTLLLLASGLAASRLRRYRRRSSIEPRP